MTCQWHTNPGLVESCTSSVWLRFHKPIRIINSLPSNIMMLTAALGWREGSSLGWFIHIEHDDLDPQPTVVRTYWFGCDDTMIQHRLLTRLCKSSGMWQQPNQYPLGSEHRLLAGFDLSIVHWFYFCFRRQLADMCVYSVGLANAAQDGFKRAPVCGFEPHPKGKGLGDIVNWSKSSLFDCTLLCLVFVNVNLWMGETGT